MALQVLPRLMAAAGTITEAEVGARYAPQPWEEILPGETVVNPKGDLPEELKQLYITWKLAEAAAEQHNTNLLSRALVERKEFADPSYQDRHVELRCLSNIAVTLGNLFNEEVRAHFPETAVKPLVFVRKGWVVIWREPAQAGPTLVATPGPPSPIH